jgi:arylformamidase
MIMKTNRPIPRFDERIYTLIGALAFVAFTAGCSEPRSQIPVPSQIVDLSPTLRPSSPSEQLGDVIPKAFGLATPTSFEHHFQNQPFYFGMSTITLHDHVGPHVDAPIHMIEGGKTIEDMPLDSLIGPAHVLDFRSKIDDEPLLPADFEGTGIKPGEIVIAVVGYRPPSSPEEVPSYPYLSGEAAEYLASIPVRAFASDMPSTGSMQRYGVLMGEDPRTEYIFPEHLAFLKREIPLIEGLVNVEQLIGKDFIVFVGFPLKLEGAGGGLMRAAALIY